ncbi:MAG: BPL-N domain-containing protein [Clostridia bacterium]
MPSKHGRRIHTGIAAVALALAFIVWGAAPFSASARAGDEPVNGSPLALSAVRPVGIVPPPGDDISIPRLPPLPAGWTPNLAGTALPDVFFASTWGRDWGEEDYLFPPREELPDDGDRAPLPEIRWTWGEVRTTESDLLALTPRDVPRSGRNLIKFLHKNGRGRAMKAATRSAARFLEHRYGSFPHQPAPLLLRIIPPEPSYNVGVYAGRGSWEENVLAIGNFLEHYEIEHHTFDDADFDELSRFDAVWFPGGFSAEYRAYVPDHEALRDFVAEGGVYFGTCAGAYYAARTTVWDGDAREGALDLFPGSAVGPQASLGGWGNPTEVVDEADIPFEGTGETSREMYYMDGPHLVPEDPGNGNVEILARYGVSEEPAVVAGGFGRGFWLLMGPHPEMGKNPDSGEFDLDGGEGSHWPWLYELIRWALAR